jgi:hypothetical protein
MKNCYIVLAVCVAICWYNFMLNTLAALLSPASSAIAAIRLACVAAVTRSAAVRLPALAAATSKLTIDCQRETMRHC